MKKSLKICLVCLLALVAAWVFWPSASAPSAPSAKSPAVAAAGRTPGTAPGQKAAGSRTAVSRSAASTNREALRLANTTRTLGELVAAPHAIHLENALVDTDAKTELEIPKHLRAAGQPGAFIVQSRGPVNAAFRATLADAGAEIVSYIPNNAYLVQLSGAGAGALAGNPQVQAVLPYEPYYKIQSSLLGRAVENKTLPPGQVLTLGLFSGGAEATVAQIQKLGGQVLATDVSPFGPVVRVHPASDWLALAQLPGVFRVEPATHRELANDLARVTMSISVDTVTNANWLGLGGTNVTVVVADSGVDATLRDFSVTGSAAAPGTVPPSRVTGDFPGSLIDTAGHGTHVAGIIGGNGSMSYQVASIPQGSVTNADFRGKAPAVNLFSIGFKGHDTNAPTSDKYLQEMAALTNALVENDSWDNGVNEYDLSAASYDAAVRDSLTGVTGPQPVMYVFPAGNQGGGDDAGGNGTADTITSPGTAKNVITVGALEQFRNITNIVTFNDGSSNAIWQAGTSSSNEVASYSSRGNVGIGTEGDFGRFKPDLVAPGTFVVSTRPTMWDKGEYYNPTNTIDANSLLNVILNTNQLIVSGGFVPLNAVGINIAVRPNQYSPTPFPQNFPIYFSTGNNPGPTNNSFATSNNVMKIPPGGGSVTSITPLLGSFFSCSVGNPTNIPVNLDFIIQILVTNENGDELTVLSNLNETIGPWYYYETGTSMAAPAVSGSLALIGDYFTNRLQLRPSPALLKAMLINGARLTTGYDDFAIRTNINFEGWGLVDVPNSIPAGLTNTAAGATNGTPMFFLDQSPTNALATGDSRTFNVTVPSAQARAQKLRVTLAWTDPPGNPAAGIKLVNNLDLVVSNRDNGQVFFGNNFVTGVSPVSAVVNSNSVGDSINNVESVWLSAPLGTNYAVTVVGRNVAVNAVTLDQTNVVQDYALVISCGDSDNTNGITVALASTNAVPSTTPLVTYLTSYTNGPVFNQIAGANAPWLSTNSLGFGVGSPFGTNAALQIGQTNQWHFFVVTNTTVFTNAAFVIFLPETLSVSRMGVFANDVTNATTPEADLNLFVASTPDANPAAITNLDQAVISNCVFNVNGDQSSLGRGGTKFIVYSNAQPQQAYYVGVQCNDQTAAEFGFLASFSLLPFSKNENGNQIVDGFPLPMNVPDGNNVHAGVARVFALAVIPMKVGDITVTNTITHENVGDLIGGLTHNSQGVVLNNHAGYGSGTFTTVYNDMGQPGTVPSDGPGSLRNFIGLDGTGLWQLTEVDDSATKTGAVQVLTLKIRPHLDLKNGQPNDVTVPAQGWFYEYVDVPVGYTNMLVTATNKVLNPGPPISLYLNYNDLPTFTDYLAFSLLTNGPLLGTSISYGPPLAPGRYWIGLYNPDTTAHVVTIAVTLSFNAGAIITQNWAATGPTNLLDDAVTTTSLFVTNKDLIQDFYVGLRVDHPRISDLVFHLTSPDGTRYLLMENRGGQSTNGCGATVTNVLNVTTNGNFQPNTNFINVGPNPENLLMTYTFTNANEMSVYSSTNDFSTNTLMFDVSSTNSSGQVSLSFTNPSGFLTIIMNQSGNAATNAGWTYTVGGVQTNIQYLAFTENTNLTAIPIKYAVPPFVPPTNSLLAFIQTNRSFVWSNSFEGSTTNVVPPGTSFAGGWFVNLGSIEWLTNGWQGSTSYDGTNYIDLNGDAPGAITTNLPTTVGTDYQLTFAYARNPDTVSSNAVPSAQLLVGTNVFAVSPSLTNAWTNLQWAVTSVVFTATSPSTQVSFNSITNGVLLDAVSLESFSYITNTAPPGNLYYLPEQDISGLNGTSPFGKWTLEVLDDRIGATNNATLMSWSLNFTFANTNFTIPTVTITNSGPITNTIPGGATAWYLIQTPTNADIATNALIFATLPLNMWWSTNVPPSTTNLTDLRLLTNSIGGTNVFGTNAAAPPFFTPGRTYYLGVQNPNTAAATYAIDVTFHLAPIVGPPFILTLRASNVTFTNATLNSVVVPNGLPTTVWFDWGTSTNFNDTNFSLGPTTNVVITTNLNTFQFVPIGITNLISGTRYYFRAVATNNLGTNFGRTLSFVAALSANVYTAPATLLTGPSAQLNGFATASGSPALAWFEYGTSPAYGTNTPPVPVGGGYGVVFVTNLIAGLSTNIPYHYRLVVSNLAGTNFGYDQIFDQANVATWGADFQGQTTPLPSSLTNLVVGIAAGYDFSLALNYNGSVVAWGDGVFGQTNVPVDLTNAVAVSGGYKVSLALRSDRTVSVWGSSQFRQTNVPPNLNDAIAAVSGDWHCLALRTNGLVVAWGNNSLGQTNIPVGLSNVVAIAAGGFHSLALRDDGTVAAWGDNTYGQINIPTNLNSVVAIAAGEQHSLALRNDGTLVSWGDNSLGQVSQTPPGSNFIAVACGGFHSLALKFDGTIVQWGDSSVGQMTGYPVGLSNVVAIAGAGGGGFHSLALTSLYGINQTNNAPFWTNGLNGTTVTMDEMTTLLITNRATDTNVPAQILFYQLVTNAPSWVTINQQTGVITCTPQEADGPSTNVITTIVTDNGYPILSATNSFTLVVNEVNRPPFWPPGVPVQTNYTLNAMSLLTVTNTASDLDIPTNALFYAVSVSPTNGGTPIISPTGIITWRPLAANVYTLMTVVHDLNPYALTNQSLSATNFITVTVLPPLTLTNGVSQTNTVSVGGTLYYLVNVPTNADFATNTLLAASPNGVNLWFSTNFPPTAGVTNDTLLLTNSIGGNAVLGTATAPKLVPGSFYWLAVQNTNATAVSFGLEVDFHLTGAVPPAPITISSIVYTNIGGTNGFLLTWFAPSNDLFKVQWTASLPPSSWNTFTNIVSYNTNFAATAASAKFTFFDDGTQAPFTSSPRFYRLLLLQATNIVTLPPQTNLTVNAGTFVTVANPATDSSLSATVTYSLVNPPANASIDASGTIRWTNASPSGLAARFTTIATDNGVPAASATNTFTVFVLPIPSISSVVVTPTNTVLTWSAPTSDVFNLQWTTNLISPVWTYYPNNVSPLTITSGTGTFTVTDTNLPSVMKFYRLILLP